LVNFCVAVKSKGQEIGKKTAEKRTSGRNSSKKKGSGKRQLEKHGRGNKGTRQNRQAEKTAMKIGKTAKWPEKQTGTL
jgi:hypothetical protein